MFDRGRRSGLSRALQDASDPTLRNLRDQVTRRQEEVAELELELFDLSSSLAEFDRKVEIRIRPLERQLAELRAQLEKTRYDAERRAQWGADANLEEAPDVVKQFQKAWTPSDRPRQPKPAANQPTQAELKELYRSLAKRFHPDLTTDPDQKSYRADIMARVNMAYEAGDLLALRELDRLPDAPPPVRQQTRQDLIAELQAEVIRLDGLISKLKRQIGELGASHLAQLQLDVSMAFTAGRDLLGEMARDLELEIARVQAELGSYA